MVIHRSRVCHERSERFLAAILNPIPELDSLPLPCEPVPEAPSFDSEVLELSTDGVCGHAFYLFRKEERSRDCWSRVLNACCLPFRSSLYGQRWLWETLYCGVDALKLARRPALLVRVWGFTWAG
jgi:hypothetical protein